MSRISLLLAVVALLVTSPAAALFEEVTEEAFGVPSDQVYIWIDILWPDYNNDGYPDLHTGGDAIHRNNGDGTFTLMQGIGLDTDHGNIYRATWGDADNDGDLDCLQSPTQCTVPGTTYEAYYFENGGPPDFTFTRFSYHTFDLNIRGGQPLFIDGDGDALFETYLPVFGNWDPDYGRGRHYYYRADGGEIWSDITAATIPLAITPSYQRHTRGANDCDYDNDGDLDIFLPVYGVDWADPSWHNILWRNDGHGNFTDVAAAAGVAVEPHGRYGIGLASGASWGDYDNDGDFDLACANIHGWVAIWNNGGDGTFTNLSEELGMIASEKEWHNTAWGDLDNDGDLDLFTTQWYGNGAYIWENGAPANPGHFSIRTAEFGILPGMFRALNGGVALADYDRDGDLDLAYEGGHVTYGLGLHLWRNDLGGDPPNEHWLMIDLQGDGVTTPLNPLGAQVQLEFDDGWSGIRQIESSSGDHAMHQHTAHFGLAHRTSLAKIHVNWPGGVSEYWTFSEIGGAVDTYISLTRGSGHLPTAVDFTPVAAGALMIDGLYPNPATTRTTLRLSATRESAVEISLFDVSGRVVKSLHQRISARGPLNVTLGVADLPAGVYLARAVTPRGDIATTRLLVLH